MAHIVAGKDELSNVIRLCKQSHGEQLSGMDMKLLRRKSEDKFYKVGVPMRGTGEIKTWALRCSADHALKKA